VGEILKSVKFHSAIPLHRSKESEGAFCDHCGTPSVPYPDSYHLDIGYWTYADGLPALFEACLPDSEITSQPYSTEPEVRRLVLSISRATSFLRMDLNQGFPALFGGAGGMILGGVIAACLGEGPTAAALIVSTGLVVGGVGGLLLAGLRSSWRSARELVFNNVMKYGIDPVHVLDAAEGQPRRIRLAAQQAAYLVSHRSPTHNDDDKPTA